MGSFFQLIRKTQIKSKDWIILILFFSLLSVIGYFLPQAINQLFQVENQTEYENVLWFLIFLYLAQYVLRIFYQVYTSLLSRNAIGFYRNEVFNQWLIDRSTWTGTVTVDRYSVGEIQARLLTDTNSLKEAVDNGSLTIFFDFFLVIACLISFISINFNIGVCFFLLQILVIFALIKISKALAPVFHEVRRKYAGVTKDLTDILKGLSQIFKLHQNNYATMRMKSSQESYLKVQLNANLYDSFYFSFAESLFPLFLAFLVMIFPVSIGKDLALLAVLIDLIQRSVMPMKDLANKITTLQRVFTGIERVTEFQGHLRPINIELLKEKIIEDPVYIEFNLAAFSYENINQDRENFKLHPLSFRINKGESLGIAGRSGAGKSTVVKILTLQLYGPETTVHFHYHANTRKISFKNQEDLAFYAQQVCIVSQESHLFSTSIFYNISLSHELSDTFLKFWDEMSLIIPYLKEWGITPQQRIIPKNLSYGQRQFLSALRAIYLKRPIIIFDEISAGMDKTLEVSLYQLLKIMTKDCLTIIVAHRLETIKRCNSILLIDGGLVQDYGSHQDLWVRSMLYKEYLKEAEEN